MTVPSRDDRANSLTRYELAEAAYRVLEDRLAAPGTDRQDGLRLAWPAERRWLHLRASGTEPILRIIAEAPTAEGARALVEAARQALAGRAPARAGTAETLQ